MQMIAQVSRDIIHGLLWFIETGWDVWASLFDSLPYGDPYGAAPSMAALSRAFEPCHNVRSLTPEADIEGAVHNVSF